MKTISRKTLMGIFIICILSLFFSQSLEANQLVGKWRMQAQNKVLDLVLNQNGTGSLSGQNFNYRLQGNQLIINYPNGSSENMNFSLFGNNLTLTLPNGAAMTFTRMGGSSPSPVTLPGQPSLPGSNSSPGGNPNIIGTWTGVINGQQVVMEIKPGGTMIFAGQTLQYTLQPGQLIITVSGQPTAYGMQVSGNQMMLTGADIGGTVTFTRKGSGPGPGLGGLGSLSGPKAPTPAKTPVPGLPGSSFPPASQQPSTSPMNMQFDVYTLKSDSSVKVAYPRGWTVKENQYGVSMVEKQTTDTAGVEIMVLQLPANINTNQALAQMLINNLRQQVYPDLKVLQQGPHSQAPQVLNISLTYSSQGIPFQALSWCVVNTQNRIGIFATFYAPNSRFPSFNPQQVLVSCMGPLIGGGQ
jgi:hypothetical protein